MTQTSAKGREAKEEGGPTQVVPKLESPYCRMATKQVYERIEQIETI